MPKPEVNSQSVYHLFVIRHTERDKIAAHLAEKYPNISTLPNSASPAEMLFELNHNKGAFPNAEKAAAERLSIPRSKAFENQQRYVW